MGVYVLYSAMFLNYCKFQQEGNINFHEKKLLCLVGTFFLFLLFGHYSIAENCNKLMQISKVEAYF